MLSNELTYAQEVLQQFINLSCEAETSVNQCEDSAKEFQRVCSKVREAWTFAVFSNRRREPLKRYFTYHMQHLCELDGFICANQSNTDLGTAFEQYISIIKNEFISLTRHMLDYYAEFVDQRCNLPLLFWLDKKNGLEADVIRLFSLIEDKGIALPLKRIVKNYFANHISASTGTVSLQQLFFLESLLLELSNLFKEEPYDDINKIFIDRLIALNFNHLDFLRYLQQDITLRLKGKSIEKQLALLSQEADNYAGMTRKGTCFDPSWPAINVMLTSWLVKKSKRINYETPKVSPIADSSSSKITLDISVGHLAFFIRLFTRTRHGASATLTDIFKFVAAGFATKRQRELSYKSLSKEYYSTDQVTAAKVRGMLQEMILNINEDFFR